MKEPVIVIDNGAWDIKFGYAGQPESLQYYIYYKILFLIQF
jgi:actin-related protein